MPIDDEPVVLATGGVTHVVRIGATVRRPVRPFTATIQAYLAHLHAGGFTQAPVPLGYDEQGREVLSFVEGEVPDNPLPPHATGEGSLAALGALLRRLHDVAATWTVPDGAVFGAIPGDPRGLLPPLDPPELVGHLDYCPGNVVFRDGRPAALIDFDLARPTTRVADLVNALRWWVPLVHPVDRPDHLHDVDAGARARVLVDAYGLDAAGRARVVPAAIHRARNATVAMAAAAQVDPVFRHWWDGGVRERCPRTERWLDRDGDRIAAALQ